MGHPLVTQHDAGANPPSFSTCSSSRPSKLTQQPPMYTLVVLYEPPPAIAAKVGKATLICEPNVYIHRI